MSVTLAKRSDLDEQHRIALMVNEDLDRVNGFIGHTAWLIGMARIQRENPGMLYPFPTDNPFSVLDVPQTKVSQFTTDLAVQRELLEAHNEMAYRAYFPVATVGGTY